MSRPSTSTSRKTLKHRFGRGQRRTARYGLACMLALGGCSTSAIDYQPDLAGAGHSAKASATQAFDRCRDRTIALDADAQLAPSRRAFKQVALSIDRCLQMRRNSSSNSNQERQMQLHALGILNFIRAAEYDAALARLQAFELMYPGADLLFSEGHSLVATFQLLLADHATGDSLGRALLHSGQVLKTRAQ